MPVRAYCYRMGHDAVLLSESEWAVFAPYLKNWLGAINKERELTGKSIEEARRDNTHTRAAMDAYRDLTGETLDHPEKLWVVRAAEYGRKCNACGKPFRTPRAKMCAECGLQLPSGEVAGPLLIEGAE